MSYFGARGGTRLPPLPTRLSSSVTPIYSRPGKTDLGRLGPKTLPRPKPVRVPNPGPVSDSLEVSRQKAVSV